MCPPCFLTTLFTADEEGGHIGPPLHYFISHFPLPGKIAQSSSVYLWDSRP